VVSTPKYWRKACDGQWRAKIGAIPRELCRPKGAELLEEHSMSVTSSTAEMIPRSLVQSLIRVLRRTGRLFRFQHARAQRGSSLPLPVSSAGGSLQVTRHARRTQNRARRNLKRPPAGWFLWLL
jgi:hypothetical protein